MGEEMERVYNFIKSPVLPVISSQPSPSPSAFSEEEKGSFDEYMRTTELLLRHSGSASAKSSSGIAQSLGLKEFLPFLQLKAQSPPPQGLPSSNDGQSHTQSNDSCTLGECRSRCIEQLKTATRRYARKQRRWIINRLVPCQSECFRLYRLNASSISGWEQTVLAPALQICGPLCAAGENCDILPSNTFNHLVEALPAVP